MTGWTAVVPIKRWCVAKSRLNVEEPAREALAGAFAADVLAAVTGCPDVWGVVVVSDQEGVEDLLPAGRGLVLDDPGRAADPLSSAIDAGVRWARSHRRKRPVVVVPADLPALTAAGLSEVLGVAARHEQAFVPDASGTGTTMLMSRTAESVLHSYGVGSAARHAELGAVAIAEASPGARHDVDTLDDLEHARGLVLGPRTVSALRLLSVDAPEVDRPHRAAKALGALPE